MANMPVLSLCQAVAKHLKPIISLISLSANPVRWVLLLFLLYSEETEAELKCSRSLSQLVLELLFKP